MWNILHYINNWENTVVLNCTRCEFSEDFKEAFTIGCSVISTVQKVQVIVWEMWEDGYTPEYRSIACKIYDEEWTKFQLVCLFVWSLSLLNSVADTAWWPWRRKWEAGGLKTRTMTNLAWVINLLLVSLKPYVNWLFTL